MEKDFDSNDLSNIEVTFSPDTEKRIDELDAISLDNKDVLKEQQNINKSLEESLSEIVAYQKQTVEQNNNLLKAIENLNGVKNDNTTEPETIENNPIIKELEDLKVSNNSNNQQLVKEIQTLNNVNDNSLIVQKLDDLNLTLKDLETTTVNQTTNVEENTKNVSSILNQSETNNKNLLTQNNAQNLETLNKFETINQENLNEIKNISTKNTDILNQNGETFNDLKSVIQKSDVTNQNIAENQLNQTQNFESVMSKIENNNNANVEKNEQIVKTLNDIQTSNNATNVQTVEAANNTTNNNNNTTFNQTNADNTVVQSKIVERLENLTTLQKETLEKEVPVKEEVKTTSSQPSNSDVTTTNNTNTTNVVKKETANNFNSDSIVEALNYSIQLQGGMIELLQKLVDGQNMKRYSDPPIKN